MGPPSPPVCKVAGEQRCRCQYIFQGYFSPHERFYLVHSHSHRCPGYVLIIGFTTLRRMQPPQSTQLEVKNSPYPSHLHALNGNTVVHCFPGLCYSVSSVILCLGSNLCSAVIFVDFCIVPEIGERGPDPDWSLYMPA